MVRAVPQTQCPLLACVKDTPGRGIVVGVCALLFDAKPHVGPERIGQPVGHGLAMAHNQKQLAGCKGGGEGEQVGWGGLGEHMYNELGWNPMLIV